jgi:hypothetical protein
LFATTSMLSLCLALTRDIRFKKNMLLIELDPVSAVVAFEYFDNGPPWRTTCPAAKAIAKLERVLFKRLRWYRCISMESTEVK